MENIPSASGPVFTDDNLINLYYLNELYANIADHVSRNMLERYQMDIPLTSGIWGGTYLMAEEDGKARRRIWRLYCIINLPQNSPLDDHSNLERLIALYSDAFTAAFSPYDLQLSLKMWGGKLPYSCTAKPSFTLHMEDATKRVHWLRAFFVWNHVPWEQSIIYDSVRILKEYKEFFDLDRGPVSKKPKDVKFLLQDIIIIYRTLEKACHPDFVEHAEPYLKELMDHFMMGLHDPKLIMELYHKVFEGALIYGYEQALEGPFRKSGLDIHKIQYWPVETINQVPEELKEKLILPIKTLFAQFKSNLDKKKNPPV